MALQPLPKSHPTSRSVRFLLYSHDSFGLGHLRRTLTLAASLRRQLPSASILIATGSPCATRFALPEGVDVVKLPSAGKDDAGHYVARGMPGSSFHSLVRLRSRLLAELVSEYRPHLMLVDHKVTGLAGELLPAFERAKTVGTRLVLGLRDILDTPGVVAKEWGTESIQEALAERYHRVLVYGTPEVYDLRQHYPLPESMRAKVEFTGYVVRPPHGLPYRALPSLRPQVLVTVGGGEDGAERVEAYLDALEGRRPDWTSLIVLGPMLDSARARHLKRRARRRPDVRVHSFYEDMPRLLAESSAVVSMAGYNTVAEVLQARRPAVLLPRTQPRAEQLLRSERLRSLGIFDYLSSRSSEALYEAVELALARGRLRGPLPSLDGADAVAAHLAEELGLQLPSRPALSS